MRSQAEREETSWISRFGAASVPIQFRPMIDILDQLPVGVGLFDSAGCLFHANQHFERTAGGPIADLHAMDGEYWSAMAPDGTLVDEGAYPGKRALLGQMATPGLAFVRKTDGGEDHWVMVSAVPLTVPETSLVVGVVVVCEDLNARRPGIIEHPEQQDGVDMTDDEILTDVQIYLVASETSSDLLRQFRMSSTKLKTFSSQRDLIDIAEVLNPGCVIVDLRGTAAEPNLIPDILSRRPADLQVIFIGSAGTPANQAMQAMRAGAIDYLVEPMAKGALAAAIHRASGALSEPIAGPNPGNSEKPARLSALSRREREVLLGLVSGGTNKMIARTLNISPRTVEVHRAHLMERLNVRNLTELLHMAHEAGLRPHEASGTS
jgi:FixJ family two-component response regulator